MRPFKGISGYWEMFEVWKDNIPPGSNRIRTKEKTCIPWQLAIEHCETHVHPDRWTMNECSMGLSLLIFLKQKEDAAFFKVVFPLADDRGKVRV